MTDKNLKRAIATAKRKLRGTNATLLGKVNDMPADDLYELVRAAELYLKLRKEQP